MNAQPPGLQQGGLLPPGSIVELEVYHCVVRMPEIGETPAVVVTCDTLKRALVISAEALARVLVEYKVMPHTERFYTELATAFQRQCVLPEQDRALWILNWSEFLDRRLMSIVKLEIQPSQGDSHVTR